MPRKKVPVSVPEVVAKSLEVSRSRPRRGVDKTLSGEPLIPGSNPVYQPEDDIIFPGMPAHARVRMSRQSDSSKQWLFHGWMGPEEAKISKISEWFGGGKYQVQWSEADERGSMQALKTRWIEVPGMYRPPRGDLPGVMAQQAREAQAHAAAATNGQKPAAMTPAEMVNAALFDRMMSMMQGNGGTGNGDALKVLAPLVTEGLGMIARVLGPKDGADQKVLTAMMDELREMRRELVSARTPPSPAADVNSTLGSMMKLVELQRAIADGKLPAVEAEPTSVVESTMLNLGGKLLDALMSQSSAKPGPGPGTGPRPAGTVPLPENPAMPMWERLIRQAGPQLVDAASRGIEPEVAASVAVKYIPQQFEGVLLEFLRKPDADVILGQVVPGLQEFATWRTGFIVELRLMFQEDHDDPAPA